VKGTSVCNHLITCVGWHAQRPLTGAQVRRRQREAQRVALAPQGRAIAGNSNEKNKNIDSITSMNTPRAIDHCSESQTRLALSANASNASPAGNVHATVPSLAKVILSRQSLSDQAELTTAHPSEGADKPSSDDEQN